MENLNGYLLIFLSTPFRAGRGATEDPSCSYCRNVSHCGADIHLQEELGQIQGYLGDRQGLFCSTLWEAKHTCVFL